MHINSPLEGNHWVKALLRDEKMMFITTINMLILFKILYSYGVIVLTEIRTCTTLFVLLLGLEDV